MAVKKRLPATIMHMHACKCTYMYVCENHWVKIRITISMENIEESGILNRRKARGGPDHRNGKLHLPRWRNRCVMKARGHRSSNVRPILRGAPL